MIDCGFFINLGKFSHDFWQNDSIDGNVSESSSLELICVKTQCLTVMTNSALKGGVSHKNDGLIVSSKTH